MPWILPSWLRRRTSASTSSWVAVADLLKLDPHLSQAAGEDLEAPGGHEPALLANPHSQGRRLAHQAPGQLLDPGRIADHRQQVRGAALLHHHRGQEGLQRASI